MCEGEACRVLMVFLELLGGFASEMTLEAVGMLPDKLHKAINKIHNPFHTLGILAAVFAALYYTSGVQHTSIF